MNEERLQQADALQREGRLPEAIALYELCLQDDPQCAPAMHHLGLALVQLNDLAGAIGYFERALEYEKTDASLYNNLANAYQRQGQTQAAIANYEAALALNPHYAQALSNLASLQSKQGELQQALQYYKQAVHAQPDFTAAHFNLGLLLLKMQAFSAAQTQFNNVITLNPEFTEAHFYLGILALQADELKAAEQSFQQVLRLEPEHPDALVNLGVIALKQEQPQQAIAYFTQALVLDNNHLDARNNLASTFMHHDRFENALIHYEDLLQQQPDNPEYRYNAGVAEMALGHLDKAEAHFLHLGEDFAALNNLAAIELRRGDRAKAEDYLSRAVALNPGDTASRHMLNALQGKTVSDGACEDYARNLFNNYALYYDQHLQQQLQYALPQQIIRLIHAQQRLHFPRTLDLGCGTGLTGVVLRELSGQLIGVDIAAKMLAQAKSKGIYDELIEAEIIQFLQQDKPLYDLIVAADVLPYLGDLQTFFQVIKARMQADGLLVFSIEVTDRADFKLEETARFSHQPDYIQRGCAAAGLEIIQAEKTIGRQQNQQPVDVLIYLVRLAA